MAIRQAKMLTWFLVFTIACQTSESRMPDSATTASSAVQSQSVAAPKRTVDSTPSGVIRRYYAAIDSENYGEAYALWADSGRASRRTPQEFADGFSLTETVNVAVSDSVRIEGAAGSQYATVPLVVEATLRVGKPQRYVGTYTLRRSMVDGASPEQRVWRIYSAHLRKQNRMSPT